MSLFRHQRRQDPQFTLEPPAGLEKIELTLERQPIFGLGASHFSYPQRHLWSDRGMAVDDLVDPDRRNSHRMGKIGLPDAHAVNDLVPDDRAGQRGNGAKCHQANFAAARPIIKRLRYGGWGHENVPFLDCALPSIARTDPAGGGGGDLPLND